MIATLEADIEPFNYYFFLKFELSAKRKDGTTSRITDSCECASLTGSFFEALTSSEFYKNTTVHFFSLLMTLMLYQLRTSKYHSDHQKISFSFLFLFLIGTVYLVQKNKDLQIIFFRVNSYTSLIPFQTSLGKRTKIYNYRHLKQH